MGDEEELIFETESNVCESWDQGLNNVEIIHVVEACDRAAIR